MAPLRMRVAVGVGGADPHPLEAGPGGPDVVIHLPAGPEAVRLVGAADRLDDRAPDGQAEVRQAVQRLQRARRRAEALTGQRGGPGHFRRARAAEHPLLVPRAVGRGASQPPPRFGERLDQQLQASRPEHRAALDENHDRRVAAGSQPVETGGRSQRLRGSPSRKTGQRRLGRERIPECGIRAIGQQHDPGPVFAAGLQRPHGLDQARRLGVRMHPHHDTRTHRPTVPHLRLPVRHQLVTVGRPRSSTTLTVVGQSPPWRSEPSGVTAR